jgi:hypothetical protein
MDGTATTGITNSTLRQRITAIIATIGFILAMLLGGGAPYEFQGKPTPTPAAVTPAP